MDPGPQVTYEAGTGLPLTVPIVFDSDIGIGAPDTVGNAWVVWSWTETENENLFAVVADSTSGTTFSTSAAPIDNGIVTFALSRTGNMPRIDTYTFTLAAKLMYQNTASLPAVLLYERSYTITVQRKGTAATETLNSGGSGSTNAFDAVDQTAPTSLFPLASPATGLSLVAQGGAVSSPAPIVLYADSTEPYYKVWMSDTASVKVFSDAGLSTLKYEWPASLVASSSTAESLDAVDDVTITLKSVPEAIYDMGTIYIALNVNFRDTEGGRRNLRRLEDAKGEEQKASVVAEVQMISDKNSGSYQFKILGFYSVSTVAGAAAALLL